MNNGNTNNNNKNNDNNYVRAAAEFQEKMENAINRNVGVSYDDLYIAYKDCRRNKRGTYNAVKFEINYEANLISLQDEINSGAYSPGHSIAFIVTKPVQREIFAADFRDRIVHHWIAMRIEPMLERIFIGESYNCRRGKGTLAGVKEVHRLVQEKSENYTKDCWVLKFDLKGFFMSINRQLVTDKLCKFIDEQYKGKDKETLIFLCRKVLLNSPEYNCIIKGSRKDWDGLSEDKSLFTVPEGYGLPIGNLTSQLIANFLLNDADHYMKDTLGMSIVRYVDDVIMVDCNKEKLLTSMPLIRKYLWESAGAKVHPHKFYFQHYTKGVKFIGSVVKKERIYIANRTLSNAYKRLHKFNELAAENPDFVRKHAENFVSSINSYLGLMRHCNAYALRRNYINAICDEWRKVVYVDKEYTKLIIKKRFRSRCKIQYTLQKQRKKIKNAMNKLNTSSSESGDASSPQCVSP